VLDLKHVVRHTDRGSQDTSIRFTERLAEAGIQPSVGAVGSSYGNALAETINGLYKTELIQPSKPWRTIEDLELASAQWVDWFNRHRLYEYYEDIPPAELGAADYAQEQRPAASCVLASGSIRTRRGDSVSSTQIHLRSNWSPVGSGRKLSRWFPPSSWRRRRSPGGYSEKQPRISVLAQPTALSVQEHFDLEREQV
jgi:hypothetical protein